MALLKVGDVAPDFTLTSSEGAPVSLRNFRGKTVILYFYPKDFTPGCTKEACSFRDDYSEFIKRNVAVIGVSYDKPERHAEFRLKFTLPYVLLSDNEKKVSKMYGTEGISTAKRVTYVINKEGKIIEVYPDVNVNNHAKEILELLDNIK